MSWKQKLFNNYSITFQRVYDEDEKQEENPQEDKKADNQVNLKNKQWYV